MECHVIKQVQGSLLYRQEEVLKLVYGEKFEAMIHFLMNKNLG